MTIFNVNKSCLIVGFLIPRYSVQSVACTVESLSLLYVLGDDASISNGSFMRSKHLFVMIHIRNKVEVGTVKHVSALQ